MAIVESFDVVVVGTGAMGAAATYQLAKQGLRVLGLDRFDPPHSMGSSHGDTRITREIYNRGPLIDLVRRSNEIWNEIETSTNQPLRTITGGVFIGDESRTGWTDELTSLARLHDIDHLALSNAELQKQFPAFHLSSTEAAVFEPMAGILRPEQCIAAQLQLARQFEAVLRTNESVTQITETSTSVRVQTDNDLYEADRVVLTTGSWITRFLASELADNIRVFRQVLYWYEIDPVHYENLRIGNFPVFVWQLGASDHQMFYGFPAVDGPGDGLKLATEQFEVTSNPDEIRRDVSRDEITATYDEFASRIEGLKPNAIRTATCSYTVTSDWESIFDWAPGSERILAVSHCMGRGFKHSAAVGESIAQMITNGSTEIDLSQYRIHGRFSSRPVSS